MMKKTAYLITLTILLAACNKEEPPVPNNEIPLVKAESSFTVLKNENLTYANGLGHSATSIYPASSFATPLKLDVYFPDNNSINRPAFMFIHGGGFTGGTKTKPEIVEMGNYYASRGWVFVSVDYRTTEELGTIIPSGMTPQKILSFYKGIAPQEWIHHALEGAQTPKQFQQSIAMYTAQRDAKAALRWIVANSSTYNINTNFLTVGGNSAGAVTTIALGISNLDDFRDEIPFVDDPTLSTTNYDVTYNVKSMVYFWGSNMKLDLFESVYNLYPYDKNDPELFMAHGTEDQTIGTYFEEALELQSVYDSLGIYNKLLPLHGEGHGAWDAKVDGKGLYELSFDFLVDRQNLRIE